MIKIIIYIIFFINIQAIASYIPFEPHTFKLNNGLKVILVENHNSPTIACRIVYHVGAKVEETGYSGISHMLEHMMFKGTKKLGTKDFHKDSIIWAQIDSIYTRLHSTTDSSLKKSLQKAYDSLLYEYDKIAIKNHFWKILDYNGAQGVNAYTTRDATVYISQLPSNKLELILAIESDRMANAVFREFYSEREVVREERRMRYENRIWGRAYELLFANVYTAHPYRNPVIGWADDIEHYTRDYLQKFHKKYYAPNNATLILVGDININETKKLIEKYFGKIPSQIIEKKHITQEPKHKHKKIIKIKESTNPFLILGYNLYDNSPEFMAYLDIISLILYDGKSSRFYKALVDKKIALNVDGYNYSLQHPGLFITTLIPQQNVPLDSLYQKYFAELKKIQTQGYEDWEILKAKNILLTYYSAKFETNDGIATLLGDFELWGGTKALEKYLNTINKIENYKTTLYKLTKEIFSENNLTIIEVSP